MDSWSLLKLIPTLTFGFDEITDEADSCPAELGSRFIELSGDDVAEPPGRSMISGGLTAAYKEIVPQFERTTGNTGVTDYGPSMGTTESAIPVRLARGEAASAQHGRRRTRRNDKLRSGRRGQPG